MDVDVEGRLLATFWTVAEVDQLQAEATRQGRSLAEVMAADTELGWELARLLRREPPEDLDPCDRPVAAGRSGGCGPVRQGT
jgi:hypothetical protein